VKSAGIVIEADLGVGAELIVKVRYERAELGFRDSVGVFFVPLISNVGKPDEVLVREDRPTNVPVLASSHVPPDMLYTARPTQRF